MSATTARAATVVMSLALLVPGALAPAEPASGADSGPAAVAPGESVQVTAVVPTRATARIAGRPTTRTVSRPTRLERLATGGWVTAARASAPRTGRVGYRIAAPQTTTRYRVVAPPVRVLLTRKVGGRTLSRRVTLRAWTGPVRTVSVTPPPAPGPQRSTELLRVRSDGAGVVHGGRGEVSADGRWVVFDSPDGVLPGDDNGQWDVFLHDRVAGTTILVSHGTTGGPADGTSSRPRVSADGRYVAFQSAATNLAPDDHNESDDVFVFDRVTDTLELVSRLGTAVGDAHSITPGISGDGRYVVFATYADNLRPDTPQGDSQVVLVDREDGSLRAVSRPSLTAANGSSGEPSISDDGHRIAFSSKASDLVAHDTNGVDDVFLWDEVTGTLRAVSRAPSRETGSGASTRPQISADGSTVVYSSQAEDLVTDDDNDVSDVFRYDVALRGTTLVSRTPGGKPGNGLSYDPDVSDDGHLVVFTSLSSDLVAGGRGLQVYLVEAGRPAELVSVGRTGAAAGGTDPTISGDGRVVAFHSDSTTLVTGTEDPAGRLYARLRR